MPITQLQSILSGVVDDEVTLHFAPSAEADTSTALITATPIDTPPLKIKAENSTHYLMPCAYAKGHKPQA